MMFGQHQNDSDTEHAGKDEQEDSRNVSHADKRLGRELFVL